MLAKVQQEHACRSDSASAGRQAPESFGRSLTSVSDLQEQLRTGQNLAYTALAADSVTNPAIRD